MQDHSKPCRNCGKVLPLTDFHKNKSNKDGLHTICKPCACAASRKWAQDNPDRARELGRQNYRRNKQAYIDRASRWSKANPERRKEIRQSYVSRNQQQEDARRQAFFDAYASDVEAYRLFLRRRTALHKTGQSGSAISQRDWNAILDLAHGQCVYCGESSDRLEYDHYVPIADGGLTEAGNLIPACPKCNRSKWKHDPEEWVFRNHGSGGLARVFAFVDGICVEEIAA